jgi:hypothetical protein
MAKQGLVIAAKNHKGHAQSASDPGAIYQVKNFSTNVIK